MVIYAVLSHAVVRSLCRIEWSWTCTTLSARHCQHVILRNGLLLSYLRPGFQKVSDGSTLMTDPAPVPRGDPFGYDVGLQQCIVCKLIQTCECLKSCALNDLILMDKHVSLQMASTCCLDAADTACDR